LDLQAGGHARAAAPALAATTALLILGLLEAADVGVAILDEDAAHGLAFGGEVPLLLARGGVDGMDAVGRAVEDHVFVDDRAAGLHLRGGGVIHAAELGATLAAIGLH